MGNLLALKNHRLIDAYRHAQLRSDKAGHLYIIRFHGKEIERFDTDKEALIAWGKEVEKTLLSFIENRIKD